MKPGKELDALIAKTMGIEPIRVAIATNDSGESAAAIEDPNGPFYNETQIREWAALNPPYKLNHWLRYRPYSTDISAAWEVVERMRSGSSGYFEITAIEGGNIRVVFDLLMRFTGEANTAPHAISLAALKVAGPIGGFKLLELPSVGLTKKEK